MKNPGIRRAPAKSFFAGHYEKSRHSPGFL
jgi:hypothetical protein